MSKNTASEATLNAAVTSPIVSAAKPVPPAAGVAAVASSVASAAATAAPAAGVGMIWDDSNMRTSYANVCNVVGTREEISLMFGSNQSWQMGQEQVRVMLNDRIVLNPYMAKRLLNMLEKGLGEYESRFGPLAP